MSTLLEVFDKRGKLVGKCDSRCYNAKCSHCRCVCGGKNHGKGKIVATNQTKRNYQDWIKLYAHSNNLEIESYNLLPTQLELFTEDENND